MKKLSIVLVFLVTGLPAWRWALSRSWWNDLTAYLPSDVAFFLNHQSMAWCGFYIWPFAAAWTIVFIGALIVNQSIGTKRLGKDQRGFEAVDTGIPHTQFQRTGDGFQITMRNEDGMFGAYYLFFSTVLMAVIWDFISGLTTGLVLAVVLGVALGYLTGAHKPTVVKVTPNEIVITDHLSGRKRLDRKYFGHFIPYVSEGAHVGRFGYSYGLRSAGFGGRLGSGKIVEATSALNQLMASLQIAPRATSTAYASRVQRPEF